MNKSITTGREFHPAPKNILYFIFNNILLRYANNVNAWVEIFKYTSSYYDIEYPETKR